MKNLINESISSLEKNAVRQTELTQHLVYRMDKQDGRVEKQDDRINKQDKSISSMSAKVSDLHKNMNDKAKIFDFNNPYIKIIWVLILFILFLLGYSFDLEMINKVLF
ncbi:hypothetical protein D7Z54_09125 [Salibacterium salarium]|uniref:Uncharacterized protein n=1 Tax=Salibacterium salarium TaxID=284579 RepID=A0A428N5Z8_9BACI|nr:hypothetical protein [Salibacterium salarium]RSL33841.1 hypothetical protein D7Z54_09125 [Salibacterium salarium]